MLPDNRDTILEDGFLYKDWLPQWANLMAYEEADGLPLSVLARSGSSTHAGRCTSRFQFVHSMLIFRSTQLFGITTGSSGG